MHLQSKLQVEIMIYRLIFVNWGRFRLAYNPKIASRGILKNPRIKSEGNRLGNVRDKVYSTPSNSTSNSSVAFGGIKPPAPRAP